MNCGPQFRDRHSRSQILSQALFTHQPKNASTTALAGALSSVGRSYRKRESGRMSLFFQVKSSYWRLRAEETRVLAENMTTNLNAYGAMLRIADEYERLADMADRENARNAPVEALPEAS